MQDSACSILWHVHEQNRTAGLGVLLARERAETVKLSEDRATLVCEQCGARGAEADDVRDMMRRSVQELGFGYAWTHKGVHTAHFYCPKCKGEFNCEVTK